MYSAVVLTIYTWLYNQSLEFIYPEKLYALNNFPSPVP